MLAVGETIEVVVPLKRNKIKRKTGEVIALNNKHFTVSYGGHYNETLLLSDLGRAYRIEISTEAGEADDVALQRGKTLVEQAAEILSKEHYEQLILEGKVDREIAKLIGIDYHMVKALKKRYELIGKKKLCQLVKRDPEPQQSKVDQDPVQETAPIIMSEPESQDVKEVEGVEDETAAEYPSLPEIKPGEENVMRECEPVIELQDKTQTGDEVCQGSIAEIAMTHSGLCPRPEIGQEEIDALQQAANLEPNPEPLRIYPDPGKPEIMHELRTLKRQIEQMGKVIAELQEAARHHHHCTGGNWSSKGVV